MATATEERIRACLVREGVCEDDAAQRLAAVIADEIERGDSTKVEQVDLDARMAQLDATVAQLGREFAEQNAQLATEMRDFVISMQELERARDERERERDERERQRDERERERDERERQRDAKWEDRIQRFQLIVYVGFGMTTTAIGVLATVQALFG